MGVKRIKTLQFWRVQLIIQKKVNLSFIAFFEPSTTKILMLSLIRLPTHLLYLTSP